MRKTILLLVATIAISISAYSQLNISTSLRSDAVWNDEEEDWEVYSVDSSGTFFEFNKELSMFKHVTATITSNYRITKWDFDEENLKYTMDVVSDVGNEYEMIIDAKEEYIAFFYWDKDEDYILVYHSIKNLWFKD